MRYPPEHKEETIRKIVKNAGAVAKKKGFQATGVDDLIKASGLTSGAFYKHFASKDELLQSVIRHEMGRTKALFFDGQEEDEKVTLSDIAKQYLSVLHVAHPESGCMLPSLTAEVARADDASRDHFENGLLELHQFLSSISNPQTAWAALSMSMGAISIARASTNESTQKAILSACVAQLKAMDTNHSK